MPPPRIPYSVAERDAAPTPGSTRCLLALEDPLPALPDCILQRKSQSESRYKNWSEERACTPGVDRKWARPPGSILTPRPAKSPVTAADGNGGPAPDANWVAKMESV